MLFDDLAKWVVCESGAASWLIRTRWVWVFDRYAGQTFKNSKAVIRVFWVLVCHNFNYATNQMLLLDPARNKNKTLFGHF